MQPGPASVVLILLACLALVGVAAHEHDPGTAAPHHHAARAALG